MSDDFQPPEGLRTDEFLLRQLVVADAQLDYEAVMESKEFLRVWEGTDWPEHDFTVEANRADMQVRTSRLADGLDRRLLDAVGSWLENDWPITGHVVVTVERLDQQVAMIESAGLKRTFRLTEPGDDGASLAFGSLARR